MITKAKTFLLIALLATLVVTSCSNKRQVNQEALKTGLEQVRVKRYEQALFQMDTLQLQQELQRIQNEYHPFLDADLTDTANINQIRNFITDKSVRMLYQKTSEKFSETEFLETELTMAFKHMKYYFPDWNPPQVYTYVSGLHYEMPVIYGVDNLIIALDMYLGEDFVEYQKIGIPMYKIKRMKRENIVADCVGEIIRSQFVAESLPENFLDKMIGEGKAFYLINKMIPWIENEFKIGFTKEELQWCKQNESRIWAYFLENELLFNTDPLIIRRFVNDGPFTAAFQKESPARVALWIGWQIVESFMKNNQHHTLTDLIGHNNSAGLLNASGYKPRRMIF